MRLGSGCDECKILMERYHADLRVYIDATVVLDDSVFGLKFDKAWADATRARQRFEQAREEVNRHIADHGST